MALTHPYPSKGGEVQLPYLIRLHPNINTVFMQQGRLKLLNPVLSL